MNTRNHPGIIALAFAAYVTFFTFISFLKYASYSYTDVDLTVVIQYFHAITKFNFIPVSYGNFSIFTGGHLPLFLILIVPAYALFPHPFTLLFLQSLFLGLGVFGVYLIARELLNPKFALYFAFAYLIFPALNYVNLFEAHFIVFSVPLLFFMFYFFLKRNFQIFLLFMFLSLLCQEDVSLVVIGVGLYALFSRIKDKSITLRWVIAPIVSGLGWFISVILIAAFMQKITAPQKEIATITEAMSRGYLGFYAWLGSSPIEILKTLFSRPFYVISHIFVEHKIRYLFQLFAPLFFLPFLSPQGLIIIFSGMSESLLSIAPPHSDIHFQYPSLIIPFIFISAILGLRNLLKVKFLQEKSRVILIMLMCVSLLSAFSIGPFTRLHYEISRMRGIKNSDNTQIRDFFVKQVPGGVPVIATFAFATHLTGRDFLCPFYTFVYSSLLKFIPQVKERYTHALVDFDDQLTFYSNFNDTPWGLKSRCFIFQEGWGLVETVDSLALFQKGYKSDYKLIETAGVIKPEDKAKFDSNLDIALLESKYAVRMIENFPVLDLTAVFAKLKPSGNNYLPVLEIVNKKGEVLKKPLIAPFRIYSFGEWAPDEVVKIRSNIFLPEQFRGSDLNVRISLVRLQ